MQLLIIIVIILPPWTTMKKPNILIFHIHSLYYYTFCMLIFVTQYDIRLQHSFATWHTTCIPFAPLVFLLPKQMLCGMCVCAYCIWRLRKICNLAFIIINLNPHYTYGCYQPRMKYENDMTQNEKFQNVSYVLRLDKIECLPTIMPIDSKSKLCSIHSKKKFNCILREFQYLKRIFSSFVFPKMCHEILQVIIHILSFSTINMIDTKDFAFLMQSSLFIGQ